MKRGVVNHPLGVISEKVYFFKTPVSQSYCACSYSRSLFFPSKRKKSNENDFFPFPLLLLLLHDGTTMRLSVTFLLLFLFFSLSRVSLCMFNMSYINEEILLFFFAITDCSRSHTNNTQGQLYFFI